MRLQHARFVRTALAAALLASGVSACVPLALVGGATATGLVITDRRSPSTQLADQGIETRASRAAGEVLGDRGHVNLTSYFRKVLITGEVPSEQDRQRVQAAVSGVGDVAGVVNELAVGPNSSITQRANDSGITAKVKTNLLNANGVPANSIKVVTERGTTYLMGRLTQRETQLATEVTRTTGGVDRVVRVIDFISEQAALHPSDSTGQSSGPTPVSDAPGSGAVAPAATSAPAATGAVTQPVTQPTIQQAPQPIQVQTLPPVKK